jgi:hypothetical protein
MDVYGKITKPFWDDRPVAIVGGGPSLVDFDFEQLRGAHVLAVKDVASFMPWADAVLGIGAWQDKLAGVQSRVYWAMPAPAPSPAKNVTFLKQSPALEISDDPSVIHGVTCEFGAMQVCIHKRAKRIVLFGFDHEGEKWERMALHFSVLVPCLNERGISVMNACPQSTIACFQKTTLDDGVAALRIKAKAQ